MTTIEEKVTFAVYTSFSVTQPFKFWTVWGTSAKSICSRWFRKYREHPLKVVRCHFKSGVYQPEEGIQ